MMRQILQFNSFKKCEKWANQNFIRKTQKSEELDMSENRRKSLKTKISPAKSEGLATLHDINTIFKAYPKTKWP